MSEIVDVAETYLKTMKLGLDIIGKCLEKTFKEDIPPEMIPSYVTRCYTDVYTQILKECALPKLSECLKEPKKCRKEALECAEKIVEKIT